MLATNLKQINREEGEIARLSILVTGHFPLDGIV